MVTDNLPSVADELWCIGFSWSEDTFTSKVYLNGQPQKDLSNQTISIAQLFSASSSFSSSTKAQNHTKPSAAWQFTRNTLASELIYFAECEGDLFVANDLVTLRRLSGSQQANAQWLLNFFTFTDDFSDSTPFLGIEAIPALACLIVDAQGHRIQRNALSSASAAPQNSSQDKAMWSAKQWITEWRKRTQAAVQQSVMDLNVDRGVGSNVSLDTEDHTNSNDQTPVIQVGIMLSSGIDSAGIAAHLAALDKPIVIKAFSWRFPNHSEADESVAVQELVNHLQLNAKIDLHFIDITHSDCFANIDTWPVNLHVPHLNAMRRLKHRLYELAAEQGCTVLLNGHMGDELCFVDRYILVELWRDNKRACLVQIIKLLKSSFGSIRQNSALRLLGKHFVQKLNAALKWSNKRRQSPASKHTQKRPKTPPERPPERLSLAAQRLFLQQAAAGSLPQAENTVVQQLELGLNQSLRSEQFALLLANSELNAMASEVAFTKLYNIERRHPYLNPELIDLSLRVPAYWLSTFSQTKWIARQALIGMLPEKLLSRSRVGQLDALFNDGLTENCAEIRQYLFRDERQWPQFIDEKVVRDVLDQQDWERAPAILVPCLGLERWLDEWRAVGLPVIINL